jgi:predicted 2-oxoglutarate/Fe(II)-dependent dioxygenase YbiX
MPRAHVSGQALSDDAFRRSLAEEPAGVVISRAPAPNGLIIVEEFAPAALCRRIVEAAAARVAEPAMVLQSDGADARLVETRRTEHLRAASIDPALREMAATAFLSYVRPHFRTALDWYEDPVVLRYREGGEYLPHADAYNWDAPTKAWRRVCDRDYSMIIYLNDDFEGGELEFKYLGHVVRPKAGLLIAFPSDWRYAHAARPVAAGEKFALVSFTAATGQPRIGAAPPGNAVRF